MREALQPEQTKAVRFGRAWRILTVYAVSLACLVWVLREVEPVRLLRETRDMAWGWAVLSVLPNVLSYAAQGWRWELLLRPAGRLSVLRATRAIFAGLFVNEVLPMRTGEILRAYLVARSLGVNVGSVVPSIVVERLMDGFWLAVSVGLLALLMPLPPYLVHAANILGAGELALTVVVLFAIVRASRHPDHVRTRGRLSALFVTLARDLHAIGTSGVIWASAFGSLLLLAGQMLAFWLVMWAYGIRLSFWAGAAVLVIMHLGTVIPSAPANAGPFQFFTVVGLELFGVDRHTAASFSIVVFLVLTLPLLVLGFFALGQSGMTLAGARQQVKAAGRSQQAGASPGS